MRYDIVKTTVPKILTLEKVTEYLKLLLSKASKNMYEPLVPVFYPVLGAHISDAEFRYPDRIWKEMCNNNPRLFTDNLGLLRNKAGLLLIII